MRALIPRFTLAGFLLAIAGAAGLYGSLTGHMRPELLQTSNPFDVCVVGNGHLMAREWNTNGDLAIRSARMQLNPQGQLVIRHRGTEYTMEPNINIPQDATSFEILPDGMVMYRSLGSNTNCHAGQLQLGQFPTEPLFYQFGDFQISTPVMEVIDQSPTISLPGQNGYGHIQSGMLIRQPSWTEALFFVGRDVFLAACGLVAIQSLWANWGLAKRQPTA